MNTLTVPVVDSSNSHEKVAILISEKIINMDILSLQFMRENYKALLFNFIEVNLQEYLELQTAF